jgi:Leishmanolysin
MPSSSLRVLELQQQLVLLLLLMVMILVSSSGIELPRIQLERFHVEYDIPHDYLPQRHDRSIQEQSSNTTAITYEPIRIAFDTRVLDSLYGVGNTDVDAKIDFIKSTILPQTTQKWAQHLYVPPVISSITPIIIGPETCGGLYSGFLTTNVQYTDADLVIIVGGDPAQICGDGTLAYAFPCNIDTAFDRPITGTFNFCLNKLSSTSLQVSDGTSVLQQLSASDIPAYYSGYTNTTFYPEKLAVSILDVTTHEVAHVLGFSDLLYPYTRDEFGVPRTARDASNNNAPIPTTRVCGNGTSTFDYLPPENVIQVVQPSTTDPTRYEHYFVTERVRAVAQIHLNCSTLIGGRLEDVAVGARSCYGSHWHERLYYSELLSPTVSEGSENILSVLTLAFMEDTGWYKVDCTLLFYLYVLI